MRIRLLKARRSLKRSPRKTRKTRRTRNPRKKELRSRAPTRMTKNQLCHKHLTKKKATMTKKVVNPN